MSLTTRTKSMPGGRTGVGTVGDGGGGADRGPTPRRIVSNFAILGVTEVACRVTSVLVTLLLMRRLKSSGFGQVEFAFNVVFWLVVIVRDCFESIVTREIARHPGLTRGLVNRVLAVKLTLSSLLFAGLAAASLMAYPNALERWVLCLYGLLLFSTALGLDFVFRGHERVGLVAVSLIVRTAVYCAGVWFWVADVGQILLVPVWLAAGEFTGIGLVWVAYSVRYGLPRPSLGLRFLVVFLRRGRSVGLIHLCQAVIVSADLLVVGVMSQWSEVGRYSAPLRISAAVMAFGLIFQQVLFPSLARSWRASPETGRRLLDAAVRVLVTGFVPIAVGGSVLAEPLVRFLLPAEFHQSGLILALGIWRAPLLCLAFLYQSSLIAMNREAEGVRLLAGGALASVPLIACLGKMFGPPGAAAAVLMIGLGLAAAGYLRLRRLGRQPAWHHHLGRPVLAASVMAPVCLAVCRIHVVAAVAAGGLAYGLALSLLGGLDFRRRDVRGTDRASVRGVQEGAAGDLRTA